MTNIEGFHQMLEATFGYFCSMDIVKVDERKEGGMEDGTQDRVCYKNNRVKVHTKKLHHMAKPRNMIMAKQKCQQLSQ